MLSCLRGKKFQFLIAEGLQINLKGGCQEGIPWMDSEMERNCFGREWGGGAGAYNSAFTPDRRSEQQVKIHGQVGLFIEPGRG